MTSTGIFNPSGDWILGHDALRAVANEQMTLAACSSQAALFSSESSKVQYGFATTIVTVVSDIYADECPFDKFVFV